jgi:hypothetical protein
MPQGFHEALLFRRPAPGTPPLAVGVPAFGARFAHSLHLAAVPSTWSRERSDSVAMSLRYAHLAPDQRREAVAKLNEKPLLALTVGRLSGGESLPH